MNEQSQQDGLVRIEQYAVSFANVPMRAVSGGRGETRRLQTEHSVVVLLHSVPAQWPIFVVCWRVLAVWPLVMPEEGTVRRQSATRDCSTVRLQNQPRRISSRPEQKILSQQVEPIIKAKIANVGS